MMHRCHHMYPYFPRHGSLFLRLVLGMFSLCIWFWLNPLPTQALTVGLRQVATGLSSITFITHAGDDRLFIVEKAGRIRILQNGILLSTPFLNIQHLVSAGSEQGLFSMAFHPHYGIQGAAGAGLFWVNYTDTNGDTVIARYQVSGNNPNVADPDSVLTLLHIVQPFSNHNGGQLQFGPVEGVAQKRYLYIGMGDGGSSGDPQDNGQRDDTVLGKILRIDPSTEAMPTPPFYTLPPDNPNPNAGILLGAIWAKGLRNPWRFSFDAQTRDVYIADVGQNRWEEINFTPAGTSGGLNYGWRIMEGQHCFNPPDNCNMNDLILPVFEYTHTIIPSRCSITGGYVYRGLLFPALQGKYLYADYCSGEIFSLQEVSPGNWENTFLFTAGFRPQTFGQDVHNELYIAGNNGAVYQIVDLDAPALLQSPLRRGQLAQFQVIGVNPEEVVLFLFSLSGTGDGPCLPPLGGLCLDLLLPIAPIGIAMTDTTGTATTNRLVPSTAPLQEVFTQAVIVRGIEGSDSVTSNTVTAPILP